MKAIALLASLLVSVRLLGGQPESLPRLTVDSKNGSEVYSNVVVTSVTATHIYFTHSLGLGSARLKDLEPEMRRHFHFDSSEQEAVQARQTQANALYEQAMGRRVATERLISQILCSAQGAATTMVPGGGVSPNPPPLSRDEGVTLKSFAGQPLFANDGPSKDDVFQGSDGDCYYMATLAALANANPDFIRKTITDLNDGTYFVRFFQENGFQTYVRVTPELWTDKSGALQYAKVGRQGCLWVPILEKAFAVCRRDPPGYDSIYGGGGEETHRIVWNYTQTPIESAGVTAEDLIKWSNTGACDGLIKDTIYAQTGKFLRQLYALCQSRKAMVMGAPPGFADNTPLLLPTSPGGKNTYHSGQHIYMVDHIEMDAQGNFAGLVLRDPYGVYRKITDFSRIFFCTGGAASVEPQL